MRRIVHRRTLLAAAAALLGPGCAVPVLARCLPGEPASAESFRLRPATYVAVAPGTLLRLEVRDSLADALLVTNRIDGQRLYDRRHWTPVRLGGTCPQLVIDYREDRPDDPHRPAATVRLTISEPVDGGRVRGLSFRAVYEEGPGAGAAAPVALTFSEVVVKREVGGR